MVAIGCLGFAVALGGCATGPDGGTAQPGAKTATGAVAGAVVGGVLGNVLGKRGVKSEGTAIGAAIGAALGGGIGYAFDSQEQKFRNELSQETQNNRIEIERVRQDALKLILPSELMFPFDSAVLQPGYNQTLLKIADVLNQYPNSTGAITGYTDSTGSETYNLDPVQEAGRGGARRAHFGQRGRPAPDGRRPRRGKPDRGQFHRSRPSDEPPCRDPRSRTIGSFNCRSIGQLPLIKPDSAAQEGNRAGPQSLMPSVTGWQDYCSP